MIGTHGAMLLLDDFLARLLTQAGHERTPAAGIAFLLELLTAFRFKLQAQLLSLSNRDLISKSVYQSVRAFARFAFTSSPSPSRIRDQRG